MIIDRVGRLRRAGGARGANPKPGPWRTQKVLRRSVQNSLARPPQLTALTTTQESIMDSAANYLAATLGASVSLWSRRRFTSGGGGGVTRTDFPF